MSTSSGAPLQREGEDNSTTPSDSLTTDGSDDDIPLSAKRQKLTQNKEQSRVRAAAALRRQVGLLWITLKEHSWLRCTFKAVENKSVQDGKGRCGIKYVDGKGASVSHNDAAIMWDCKVCADAFEKALAEGGNRPSKPDAFVQGGRDHNGMREKSKLVKHNKDLYHLANLKSINKGGAKQSKPISQPKVASFLTPTRQLQCNYLLGLIWLVISHSTIALQSELRELAVAWGVLMPPSMSWKVHIELISATAEFFRRLQRARMCIVPFFSFIGDGSTDVSTKEEEAIGVRYTWKGKARNEFVGLFELDLTKSKDKKSPDALCLEEVHDRAFNLVFQGKPCNRKLDEARDKDGPVEWIERCATCSLDGASVNTGVISGLIARLKLRAAWLYLTHALAHVVELKADAAFNAVEYFKETVDTTCRGVVATYNKSGKKQWNAARIAGSLNEKHLKLTGFSKRRYQRALARSLKSLFTNWRATSIHLHELAHEAVCTTKAEKQNCLTLSSPLENFVGRQYIRKYEGYDRPYTVEITGVEPPLDDTENEFDRPRLVAKVTPAVRNYSQEPLYKSEVVDQLDTIVQKKLDANASYQLYNGTTSARFMQSGMLLLDAREPVARLSELTQRDGLNLAAFDRKLESVQEDIDALINKPGINEAKFIEEYNTDAEVFKGIQVLNQGREEYSKDRDQYLKALAKQLKDPELDMQDPVSLSRKKLFDYAKWDKKADRETDYFEGALQTISAHFNVLFERKFGKNFLYRLERDWRTAVIFVESLPSSFSYDDRWERALSSQKVGRVAEFLIELELDFPMDTSCAERWFSLMNLVKDKRRNRMNTALLNDLMFICTHAPKSISQLKSVMIDILVLWEEEPERGRYHGKWHEDVKTTIEDLEYEQEIANEMSTREFNMDQPGSFDEYDDCSYVVVE